MKISLVLCTYNRCTRLSEILASIAASVVPESTKWEVLVVDNNSSDQTPAIVETFCQKFPGRFRYLREPQPGKSFALNSGIRAARGDIIAFTDDDVIVDPAWLQNLTASLHHGQWAGAGGRILPLKPVIVPRWMSFKEPYNLGGALCGLFDKGEQPGELEAAPFGANMAFKRTAFEKYGDFRTDLGPPPVSDIHGEDTEFGQRLLDAGERLRYEPLASVRHPVLEHRINKPYFLAWWFDHGRAAIRIKGIRPRICGVPQCYITMLHLLVRHVPLSTLAWALTVTPHKRFFRKCKVWMVAGQIKEVYRQWGSARKRGHEVVRRAHKSSVQGS